MMSLTWCYSEIEGRSETDELPTAIEQLGGSVFRSVRSRKLFEMLRSQLLRLRDLRPKKLRNAGTWL